MSKVYLVQLLCPERHCVLAAAFEEGENTPDKVIAEMKEQMKQNNINPWCGLCGSPKLTFETAPTKYDSLQAAAPVLFEEQLKQMFTRAVMTKHQHDRN